MSLSSAESASMRSYGKDWLVNPDRELEVSANLRFLVAPDGPFGGRAVRFTDVGLFGIQARYSTGGRFEFAGAVNLLAKQPTNSDEPVAQGGNLGVRFRLHRKWALWAQGAGGPMLAGLGNWGEGGGGVQARVDMHEHMRFQASLGGAYTRLYADDGKDPWFAEVASHGEMIFTWPGDSGLWLGADYRVPVAHGDGAFALDPKVRLSVEVGTTLGFVDNWDLYGVFRFIDRGDLREPSTTIPVLDGGFDQVQFLIGAAHHFELAKSLHDEQVASRR